MLPGSNLDSRLLA